MTAPFFAAPYLAGPYLAGLGLIIALAYFGWAMRPVSWLRSALKTLPLLCFAAAAYQTGAPAFLTAGLLLSALGDFAMSRNGRASFLYGLSAFALAHLVYILLFLDLANAGLLEAFALAPLAAVIMITLALSSELWLTPHTGALRWPVRAYLGLITTMGLAALTLPLEVKTISETGETFVADWRAIAILAGAILFIISDFILSLRKFRMDEGHKRRRLARMGVWLFYIAGQALILTGAAA